MRGRFGKSTSYLYTCKCFPIILIFRSGILVSFRYFSFVLVSLGTAAGEGVNSTTIQCVHEQCLTGICIFLVFYLLPMDHLCTNR